MTHDIRHSIHIMVHCPWPGAFAGRSMIDRSCLHWSPNLSVLSLTSLSPHQLCRVPDATANGHCLGAMQDSGCHPYRGLLNNQLRPRAASACSGFQSHSSRLGLPDLPFQHEPAGPAAGEPVHTCIRLIVVKRVGFL